MISNTDSNGFGWQKFTMPSCIAPGQYLMRVELLALHSATAEGGAQFYQSCAQIKVTGSGSFSPSTSNEMSLPGGYSATDPGILANIYDSSIYTSYKAPGPAVISCGASNAAPATSAAAASSKPATSAVSSKVPVSTSAAAVTSKPATTLSTMVKTSEAAAPATSAASSGSSSGTAAHWGQCGGKGWTGPTTCISGTTCKVQNDWYSQCL
ncbi:hypothetical protein KCU97_g1365, partial [Aureobasidium melanogenum]